MNNPSTRSLIATALHLACDRLTLYNSDRTAGEIRDILRGEVASLADEALGPAHLNLITLRFACEHIADETGAPANQIEDTLMLQAVERLKGLTVYAQNE